MAPSSPNELRQAYRKLYKAGLAAVQYSSPARYMLRNTLRAAFREPISSPSSSSSSSPSSSSSSSLPRRTSAPVDPYQQYRGRFEFDAGRVANTLTFLRNAARSRGMEHRIVKTLLHVRYWQAELHRDRWRAGNGNGGRYAVAYTSPITRDGYRMFEDTLRMLNDSMGLCLR